MFSFYKSHITFCLFLHFLLFWIECFFFYYSILIALIVVCIFCFKSNWFRIDCIHVTYQNKVQIYTSLNQITHRNSALI